MRRHSLAHALLCLAVAVPGASAAQDVEMERYATFVKTRRVDPERLAPYDRGTTRLDGSRRVIGRSLELSGRAHGSGESDVGAIFTAPENVTTLATVARVRDHAVPACSTPDPNAVAFSMGGAFFNDGSGGAGDATGDVHARIEIVRASDDVDEELDVELSVVRCDDAACSTETALVGPESLGTLPEDRPAILQLRWDAAGDAFGFRRDHADEIVRAYVASDSLPPGRALKGFWASTRNGCPEGDLRATQVEVRVEQVWANVGAAP